MVLANVLFCLLIEGFADDAKAVYHKSMDTLKQFIMHKGHGS